MSLFPGFPKDLFQFLEDLANNNKRAWFNANKSRYVESLQEPMCAFIEAMAPRLRRISKHYVADPRPVGGSMFRIYRDVRFSKNKSPYKTHAACQFRHEAGKDAHAPGFYVHLEPGKLFFGGGIWTPPSDHLERIRRHIVSHPDEWAGVMRARGMRGAGGIRGDGLKNPPRGYDPDLPHMEDLKRKSFYVMTEAKQGAALSPDFPAEVARGLRIAAPLNRFVAQGLGLSF